MNLGIGYTKMFSTHFGLNFQTAYNYKIFFDGITDLITDKKENYLDVKMMTRSRSPSSVKFALSMSYKSNICITFVIKTRYGTTTIRHDDSQQENRKSIT